MADRYSGNLKLCSTCAYWSGQRDVDSFGSFVTNCGSVGKCVIPQGALKNFQRSASYTACFDWKKWAALK